MRLLMGFTVICVILIPGISAAEPAGNAANCLIRLDEATLVGDSLTVLTNDSTVIRGRHPIVSFTSALLYMKLPDDSGIVENSVTISFERISAISYRKPGLGRLALPLLGFAVGAVAGGFAGAALAPEGDWLEFPEAGSAFIGGTIGGIIGAIAGHEIGKGHTKEVTLHCQ